jgi:NADH-dependent peroxiredoxin subunit C
MAETMTATTTPPLRLGQKVPDFELVTFEPPKGDFGKFSLRDQIANKRWTLLFFYPADFTFV